MSTRLRQPLEDPLSESASSHDIDVKLRQLGRIESTRADENALPAKTDMLSQTIENREKIRELVEAAEKLRGPRKHLHSQTMAAVISSLRVDPAENVCKAYNLDPNVLQKLARLRTIKRTVRAPNRS